jgi:hypothetical protein
MKAILALAASAPLIVAAGQGTGGDASDTASAPPAALDMPSYEDPAAQWRDLEDVRPSPEECRDRIRQARAAAGQPRIERDTADPEEPLMIWAVDRREHGCSVLVVKGEPEDIRPIPEPPESAPSLIPAR